MKLMQFATGTAIIGLWIMCASMWMAWIAMLDRNGLPKAGDQIDNFLSGVLFMLIAGLSVGLLWLSKYFISKP